MIRRKYLAPTFTLSGDQALPNLEIIESCIEVGRQECYRTICSLDWQHEVETKDAPNITSKISFFCPYQCSSVVIRAANSARQQHLDLYQSPNEEFDPSLNQSDPEE